MSRLSDHNVIVAKEIIARYPKKKSALIPLVHLSQEQNGYVTEDAMRHVAELIDVTPAEVYGTASFYEMFRFEPTGKYLHQHLRHPVVPAHGRRVADAPRRTHPRDQGRLDHVRRPHHAPARRVSGGVHRSADAAGQLPAPLPRRPPRRSTSWSPTCVSGALDAEIPPHGTLGRNRQQIPADRWVGASDPDDVTEGPTWIQVTPA